MEITWLGQAGFVLRSPGLGVVIDPFLSDHELRLFPPPALDVLGDPVTHVLATHEHADHLDPATLGAVAKRFPGIEIIVPAPLTGTAQAVAPGVTVHGLQPGDDITRGDLRITAVPACHGRTPADAYSDGRIHPHDPTPFLGYVITLDAVTVYHAGDTVISDGLVTAVSRHRIDVALLPVNGRDRFREQAGIVGNLSAREAVQLAARLGAHTLVPMHHDLIRGNTVRPGEAADLAAELAAPLHVLNLARFRPYRVSPLIP